MEPGLSKHAHNLTRVSEDIQSLLREAAEHVPQPQQRSSPVYVMATAGQLHQSQSTFIVIIPVWLNLLTQA